VIIFPHILKLRPPVTMADKIVEAQSVSDDNDVCIKPGENDVPMQISETQKRNSTSDEDKSQSPTDESKKREEKSLPGSLNDEIVYSDNKLYQLVDVLKQTPLKFSDDESSRITYVEAWELNLYIGTNLGEIIHLYKIDEELGYIQVSKQRFSSNTSKPIKKILLLPEISVALVHCGNTVSGYLLPEFSPANIGKAKDVSGMSIDWNDLEIDEKKTNRTIKTEDYHGDTFAKVTIFTRKSIKLLRIFVDSIRLHKELQYSDILSGIQISGFSIIANREKYELVDVSQSQRTFLFPLSTNGEKSEINPIIKFVNKKEALLVCGGSTINDPAVGMFINLNGDVVRGTLGFETYPSSISIEYPYVLAIFQNRVVVYSIFDQTKLQELHFKGQISLNIFTTMRIFDIKDSDLTEKIILAPIVSTMDNEEIEKIAVESDEAIKKAICKSSYILVDSMGRYFKILKPLSNVDRWIQIYNKTTQLISQNIYDKLFEELSANGFNIFLITLLGLFTINYGLFNQAFEIWTNNFKHLDPRLMIYIFSENGTDGIIGSVWTYRILFEKVELLRKIEKSTEMVDFFKLYLKACLKIKFEKNSIEIGKSIEIAIVKLGLISNEDLEVIICEINYATNEIVELLLLNKKYYLLSKLYSKLKDHRQLLYYWKGLIEGEFKDVEFDKNFTDKNKSLQFLLNYILTNCLHETVIIDQYSEWLLEFYPRFGLKLVTDKRIKDTEINDIKILSLLKNNDNNYELKLQYLEYILENKNEKQFIGDLILLYLELFITEYEKEPAINKIINETMSEYMCLAVPKPTVFKYWKVIEGINLKDTKFLKYHNKLYDYISLITVNVKSILNQKLVIEECEKKIVNEKYSEIFPMIILMILYKLRDYSGVVEEFIKLKDYKSAESFALTLKLEDINSDAEQTSVKSTKMENNNSSIMNDEFSYTSKNENRELTEGLLKKIFEVYLIQNETKLIDNFLNRYDLLNDTSIMEKTIAVRMDKFIEMINKVPDSFPLDRLKKFMAKNLIEFKDYNDQVNIRKTLLKVEVNKMLKLENHLNKN
jgi:hypothetical protein